MKTSGGILIAARTQNVLLRWGQRVTERRAEVEATSNDVQVPRVRKRWSQ